MLSRTLFITGGQVGVTVVLLPFFFHFHFCSLLVVFFLSPPLQGHISVWHVLTGRRVKTVLLGDDDTSVFVRYVNVCDNKTVVCDYGKEVKIVTFPAVMDKAE